MNLIKIPFNQSFVTGKELDYLQQAITKGQLSGQGEFTHKCQTWLEKNIGTHQALLTHSCTAALEMAALLIDIQSGDEIIMPSYTFVSTANAFVLRGGIPVFVDIRSDTLNLDETKLENAINSKTKAIIPVHYAGVSCEMQTIMEIAKHYNLWVIEDAAQGISATYKNQALGSIGHLGALSFHNTKNISAGEGGALFINKPELINQARILLEKGTNRFQFLQGEVDKYTWVNLGSSYLPSELIAAFLLAQLESVEQILKKRLYIWNQYHQALAELENKSLVRRPIIPLECGHNAHIYYILLPNLNIRNKLIDFLKNQEIYAVFHYIPLHSSPAGKRYGYAVENLTITDDISSRLLRLPIYPSLKNEDIKRIIEAILDFFN
ncbi:dTDP-4-amino-4,6-dideoxygalactose transaminase [Aphanothece hegewaldii CCALA 016]|uniref:dTDP-4-amino-4,6-dideoxygalactose transaminase n=1 Tax=Aphanothece hegewaldii CCALA 016 TaxID=2107694 RepID=A0A2T1LUT9_9CHRO|nr:dTDP-4-amino-4,6-dideoxygalactose transaminase [Aphanothece hegewaldii]PSF35394.1 dTDP-4-amino-4,6-dideoxygalactose transaminase [Aphanothece hegewaldii CCALA 016]